MGKAKFYISSTHNYICNIKEMTVQSKLQVFFMMQGKVNGNHLTGNHSCWWHQTEELSVLSEWDNKHNLLAEGNHRNCKNEIVKMAEASC